MATQSLSYSSSSSWASRSFLANKCSGGCHRILMPNHDIPQLPSLSLHSKCSDLISVSRKALILTRAIADSSGDEFADHRDNNVHDDFADSTSFFWAFSRSYNGVLQLGALFAVWYLFNIYFNIFNKQVLQLYPFPLTASTVQFGIGTLFIVLMWSMNLYNRPKISSSSQLLRIIPLAIAHTLGSIFTNVSLGMVAVSFTHTIKAMEPFFTVVLSSIFLGQFPTLGVLSSLLPVVGGVVLASMTELSFNWPGFWTAMASNLANQSRNVLSKKLMIKKEESLDNINLFSIITIMSFIMSIPIALYGEGIVFTPYHIQSYGLKLKDIYTTSFLAALCFHGHQQVSYMILARVSPVSHSVGNCVKRVVVIVSSVLFFRTPVSFVNALGTAMALAGVFLYTRVNSMKAKSS